jgi:hypothetical protein
MLKYNYYFGFLSYETLNIRLEVSVIENNEMDQSS